MTTLRTLFWHRRDLRMADNLGLANAVTKTAAITGIYVLDPAIITPPYQLPPIAPARLWFLIESLIELRHNWHKAGSRLLIVEGDPVEVLPRFARKMNAETVVWNREVEPYARKRDRQVKRQLEADGRRVLAEWDQQLIAPAQIKTGSGNPYHVYGPFLRNWRTQVHANTPCSVKAPSELIDLDSEQQVSLPSSDLLEPLRSSHGFGAVDSCPCRPGEKAAFEQLQIFCDQQIRSYEPDRNIPSVKGTSTLSAALSIGTISPRQAWRAANEARKQARDQKSQKAISVWEQELAWREFYQQALFHFPELALGPFRSKWRQFPWENNDSWFKAWREGMTGIPIIDAAMRQLNQSGWMHNRCRMIVASFLVKDLICDWRWGERAFMELEVDGDLAANNGGWQWSASSGMDSKPLRIFNPATQATKFDPTANYIRLWLPELRHISTQDLLSGNIGALERRGYPEPIVDHKYQQAHFKALYATINN
ncbi:MAG: FAD-binding domain-containing protein [Prochlorococcaceae cyanobacterium ETNP18_MAG_14]|nr:FAD-binding domain-containing protein [Prochlorococcaceae cyanobacterium ETNP18_MAG_14]